MARDAVCSDCTEVSVSEPRVPIPRDELTALCRRWKVRRLSLFGSVLRDDFGPDSDIDVLVE
ncbi:MAG: nucleotidyltransferase domain-containing protein, partial [Deltaproteobacteria bacterium]|nr:nucleotidyltransferase domain-containing protein [Deltaproteobacteria bacterium]